MFHGRMSLNTVLLLLLETFVSGFRLELMYVSLIVSITLNVTHFHGFQQLVLLPWFIEITFFVCTNRMNYFPESIISQKLGSRDLWRIAKVNLLYLLYSMVQRCCLLHLIKQNCLLKIFLRTLILMTWVSLYLLSLLELI